MTTNTDTVDRQQRHHRLLDVETPRLAPKYRLGIVLGITILLAGVSNRLLGLRLGTALGLAVSIGVMGWALPSEYAFVSGHLGVGVVLPPDPNLVALTLVEISLWMLLVLESESRHLAIRFGIFGVGIASLLSVFGWTLLSREPSLWNAGFIIVSVTAIALYGVHRYEIVRLGVVEEPEA